MIRAAATGRTSNRTASAARRRLLSCSSLRPAGGHLVHSWCASLTCSEKPPPALSSLPPTTSRRTCALLVISLDHSTELACRGWAIEYYGAAPRTRHAVRTPGCDLNGRRARTQWFRTAERFLVVQVFNFSQPESCERTHMQMQQN